MLLLLEMLNSANERDGGEVDKCIPAGLNGGSDGLAPDNEGIELPEVFHRIETAGNATGGHSSGALC